MRKTPLREKVELRACSRTETYVISMHRFFAFYRKFIDNLLAVMYTVIYRRGLRKNHAGESEYDFGKSVQDDLSTIAFVLVNWFSIVIVIVCSSVYGNVTHYVVVTYGYRFHDPSELVSLLVHVRLRTIIQHMMALTYASVVITRSELILYARDTLSVHGRELPLR